MNNGVYDKPPEKWKKKASYFGVDSDRNGGCDALYDWIFSGMVKKWLPSYDPSVIGRLIFIIEACFIGEFIDKIGAYPDENRIVITCDTWNTSAGGETGQDWPAFSHMLFKTMADGSTNLSKAFNVADKHVDKTNFISRWCCEYMGVLVPTDAKLDDNGDEIGSDYDLPKNSNWHDVYRGIFTNHRYVTKKIMGGKGEYRISKARVRFHVHRGLWQQVTADLHEFNFHGASWIVPTGYNDPENAWDNEVYAYDNDPDTKAGCTIDESGWIWTPFIELTLSKPLECDKIRFYAWYSPLHCNMIDVDVYYSDGYLAKTTGL